MNVRLRSVVLVIALGCAARAPAPAAAAPAAAAATPSDPAAALPGIDLSGLDAGQQRAVAAFAGEAFCACGCPHTVSGCLKEHRTCRHAPRMVRLAARLVRTGTGAQDLPRLVGAYYASFDKRVKLDVAAYGPPLGNPDAPVTLVEFSDFTCPFCRQLRPRLEEFVSARADRVKLYYKPFPIESHPFAREAAQAAEWAREHDIFWPMHDALFSAPPFASVEDVVDVARSAGGDPADLREALAAGTHRAKVEAAQLEARLAGIRGTPTLFLDGRMLPLADFTEEGLEFALEDEEEWRANRGWAKD